MVPVRVAVIGIGGFGRMHLEAIDHLSREGIAELVAVTAIVPVDPRRDETERAAELSARGVRVYRDYREMLQREIGNVDLVTIPVGIPFHAQMSISALQAGFHVLCEKPAAGSVADGLRMLETQRRTGRFLGIGFQHQLTPVVRRIKELTLARRLGRLISARTLTLWPRGDKYYSRTSWAGRLTVEGAPIYDSPLQNAAAHFLQNMLFVASAAADSCAEPASVYAENYRAAEIESADTQFVRVRTREDVTLLFVASHAVEENSDPRTEFRYERGRIVWKYDGSVHLFENDDSGEPCSHAAESFDNGNIVVHSLPFYDIIHAIQGRSPLIGGIEKSISHLRCVEAAFASSGGVHRIPPKYIEYRESESGSVAAVRGNRDLLSRACLSGAGPGEAGIPWGAPGQEILVKYQ